MAYALTLTARDGRWEIASLDTGPAAVPAALRSRPLTIHPCSSQGVRHSTTSVVIAVGGKMSVKADIGALIGLAAFTACGGGVLGQEGQSETGGEEDHPDEFGAGRSPYRAARQPVRRAVAPIAT
ncbi:hypothetical protein [Streptomyces sp. NPDC004284]|uniref:hypothetical protein n=1 Tax=Streptomyces sp. NPDC004284 TaxID=3364695 RepID=UPI003688A8D1